MRMKIAGHFGCWRMMIGLALSSASCVNRPTMKVQARYWTGTTNAFVNFPEQEPTSHVWQDLQNRADFGLCFSGGGTRSASATVGQLRALHKLGVLDKVRYTAAASGGSWALVPYTYISDNSLINFLGPYVSPVSLTSKTNMEPGKDSLTKAISEAAVTLKGLGYLVTLRGAEEYARTISDRFLKPFGLGDPKKWFTWNEPTGKEILQRNPQLEAAGLGGNYKATTGRPFPIIGATIRFYDILPSATSKSQVKRIPVEYTPLYSGVRQWWPPNHHTPAPIGGGYVESFAYDSIQPTNAGDGLVKTSFYNRRPWITSPVFNLGDMIDGSEKMTVGVKSHMNRDVGLAWLDLPLLAPPIK
jgi:hypothetical protein